MLWCFSFFTEAAPSAPLPAPVAPEIEGPSKIIEALLVLGGMDMEGEIFDDCLLYLLNSEGVEEEGATGGASGDR